MKRGGALVFCLFSTHTEFFDEHQNTNLIRMLRGGQGRCKSWKDIHPENRKNQKAILMSKKKEKKRPAAGKPQRVFKKSDLHYSLYLTSLKYFKNAPWERLGGEDSFAARVPGESHPLALSVLGAAGQEYGLSILRGPSATSHMEVITSGTVRDPSKMDYVLLSLEKYKNIPDELRRFYKRAGVKPEPSTSIPVFFVKRPYQLAREPNLEEVQMLLYVINGVLTAVERRLLREGETITPKGLLTLNLSGAPLSPTVEVADDYAESKVESLPPPSLLINRNELKLLPILNESWVVACRLMPIRVQGITDELRVLITMDEANGIVFDTEIVRGAEAIVQSGRHLVDVMLGKNSNSAFKEHKRTGRPRSITFVDSELHEILQAQLSEAGIACGFISKTPPLMQEVIDGLTGSL